MGRDPDEAVETEAEAEAEAVPFRLTYKPLWDCSMHSLKSHPIHPFFFFWAINSPNWNREQANPFSVSFGFTCVGPKILEHRGQNTRGVPPFVSQIWFYSPSQIWLSLSLSRCRWWRQHSVRSLFFLSLVAVWLPRTVIWMVLNWFCLLNFCFCKPETLSFLIWKSLTSVQCCTNT